MSYDNFNLRLSRVEYSGNGQLKGRKRVKVGAPDLFLLDASLPLTACSSDDRHNFLLTPTP